MHYAPRGLKRAFSIDPRGFYRRKWRRYTYRGGEEEGQREEHKRDGRRGVFFRSRSPYFLTRFLYSLGQIFSLGVDVSSIFVVLLLSNDCVCRCIHTLTTLHVGVYLGVGMVFICMHFIASVFECIRVHGCIYACRHKCVCVYRSILWQV